MPKKRPRQARARATYDSILDATARLLVSRGYAALTTNHVAEVAGVAIGSIYEYFSDKDVIVAEVARRTIREIVFDLERGLACALGDADAGLRLWVRAMFAAIRARRALVRALWHDVPFMRDLEQLENVRDTLLALARGGRAGAEGRLFLKNPEAMTYLLTVMVAHGVVESVIARPPHLADREIEDTLVDIVAALILR